MSVHAIDQQTVHRICSGQVVLSLAVAVKELVENSLDAGASSVEVRLKEYGSELVEISDNGCGVAEENFEALTLKYHTSKIKDFTDLEMGVTTFGFRGEALSSLCALSDLVVTTCHQSQKVGTKLEYDCHGHIKTKSRCARQIGTTVSLRNLFQSLPVRQKEFLRNVKKEFGKMVAMLQGYCLVSTEVKITCSNQMGKGNKQLVLSTTGNSHLKGNITDIFGSKQFSQLIEITQCSQQDLTAEESYSPSSSTECFVNLFTLSGYISRCNHRYGRGATDRQFFFFNNRPCNHLKLTKLVNEVYHMYNRHQYPFIALNISTSKEHVDVNVTPDKRTVMLHHEKVLLLLVKVSLQKLFEPTQGLYDARHVSSSPSPCLFADSSPAQLGSLKRLYSYSEETISERRSKQAKMSDYLPLNSTRNKLSNQNDSLLETEKPIPSSKPHPPSVSHCSVDKLGAKTSGQIPSRNLPPDNALSFSSSHDLTQEDMCLLHKDDVCNTALTSTFPVSSTPDIGKQDKIRIERGQDTHGMEWGQDITGMEQRPDIPGMEHGLDIQGPDTPGMEQGLDNCDSSMYGISSGLGSDYSVSKSKFPLAQSEAEVGRGHPLVESKPHPTYGLRASEVHIEQTDEKLCLVPTLSVTFDLNMVARRLKMSGEVHDSECSGGSRGFRANISPASNRDAEKELRREIRKSDFSKMDIIGQFNLGFIVTRLGNDLFIVDQHATDEKYNFERLQREWTVKHQILISPISLELTAVHENVVMDNLDVFKKNGFHFLIDNDAAPTKRIRLAAKPVCGSNWSLGPKDIDELVFMLCDSGLSTGEVLRPSAVRSFFASKACRTSVMIGTALSQLEMKKLVSHMGEIEQPWNCPHGRPTMRHVVDLSKISTIYH